MKMKTDKRECPHCGGSLEQYEDPLAVKLIAGARTEMREHETNTEAPESYWFCGHCDKPMAESEEGYAHTNNIIYCSKECADKHDANL